MARKKPTKATANAVAAPVEVAPSGHQHSPFDDEPRRSPGARVPSSHASPARLTEQSEVARTSLPPSPRDVVAPSDATPIVTVGPAVVPTQPSAVPTTVAEEVVTPPQQSIDAVSPSDLQEPRSSAVEEDVAAGGLSTPPNASMHDRMMLGVVNSPGASAISPCSTLPATPQAETVAHASGVVTRLPKWVVEAVIVLRALAIVVAVYAALVALVAWQFIQSRNPKTAERITNKVDYVKSKAAAFFETRLRHRVEPVAHKVLARARDVDSKQLRGKGEEHLWNFIHTLQVEFRFAQRQL